MDRQTAMQLHVHVERYIECRSRAFLPKPAGRLAKRAFLGLHFYHTSYPLPQSCYSLLT